MNWRWYLSGILIVLAFYGGSFGHASIDSNQEIVIRFNTLAVSEQEADEAISEITSRLKAVGVTDIQISNVINGKIKVTYFSTLEVGAIKNLLHKENNFDFAHTAFNDKHRPSDFPSGNDSKKYNFEVIKIQPDTDADFGLQGVLVEAKSFADQYLKPKFSVATSEVNFIPRDNFERAARSIRTRAVISKISYKHKIPQVRAGPLA